MVTRSSTISAEFEAIQTALEVLEPLSDTQRQFAVAMILSRLGMQTSPNGNVMNVGGFGAGATAGSASGAVAASTRGGESTAPDVREFLRQKNPLTDLERYLCLAYYLTRHMNMQTFKSKDIVELNGKAGGHDFSNAAVTAGNATQHSKLLSKAGAGKKRITIRGEQLVDALPERTKVKEITKSRAARKRVKRTKK